MRQVGQHLLRTILFTALSLSVAIKSFKNIGGSSTYDVRKKEGIGVKKYPKFEDSLCIVDPGDVVKV